MEEKLTNFVKNNEFNTGGNAEPFPNGKTKLKLSEATVEQTTITDAKTGKDKERWIIHTKEKGYWAGKQIMNGIKEAQEKGATEVLIVRQGEGMNTNYMVLNVEEVANP